MEPNNAKGDSLVRDLEPVLPGDDERLFNELNLLRVEGYFFCLDPKASAKYTKKREFIERIRTVNEVVERPIAIEPNPNYGYPSVLAYKVLQACMKKLSDYGYPVPESVCFSQRELARIIGRKSFGGKDSQDIFQAAMQLYKTDIWCSFYDKATQEWQTGAFRIVDTVLFSGKKDRIHQCIFKVNPLIIRSLNNRYAFWINYLRIEGFEPITTALYKHLFYHFSNIFSQVRHEDFSFNKDYADICTQWLGGLTVLKYKSKILKEQLGRHLQLLKERSLLSRFDLGKRADGEGFAFVFYPGPGFFEDYRRFYGGQVQLQSAKTEDEKKLHLPMRVVQYFYTTLYQTEDLDDFIFSEKEVAQAGKLLEKHSYAEVCGFIDYGLQEARKTAYDVKTFLGIKQYHPGFLAQQRSLLRQQAQEQQRNAEARHRELEAKYRAFRKAKLGEARENLPANELIALEQGARSHIETTHPQPIGREMLVRIEIERRLAEQCAIPSFDEWQSSVLLSPVCGV
jgi:hypothetical protein